ncbi:MAG TPA: 5'-nucleotidase, lipoprotein e(P4) family [Pyrinomonadaceae bacterium]|jgi:5'-nucleotidase (lipoprotein e(P4) family)|nr:5'-nucleotidase, lipoprotein e(P4) family [Pyrinomonadaceae bacterium]
MRSNRNYLYALVLVVCSSTATYFVSGSAAQPGTKLVPAADMEYTTAATLWMQKSGEYRALAYQAFNIARWQLDLDLKGKNKDDIPKPERKKPRAVMVDIDETVLDNSPDQARRIVEKEAFDLPKWYAWGEMRKAKAIPGAVDFLNYATSKGVKVFYVSNRDEVQKQATMDNLISAGFMGIGADNVLLRQKDEKGNNISTKEFRRDIIRQKYRIVFFMGDNLDDHSNVFERKSIADRFAVVDQNRGVFGKKYILLPNAMYGTWENAVYDYKNPSDAEKVKLRLNALELP